jgi:sialic acid synthase SpsE
MKLILDCCNNHMGDSLIIEKMIAMASGHADYVKFQLYNTEELNIAYPDYITTARNYEKCEINSTKLEYIFDVCGEYGITPMFTIFSLSRLKDLEDFDDESYFLKIASPNGTDMNFIRTVKDHMSKALYPNPLIISQGMSTYEEIKPTKINFPDEKYLYCVSRYPTVYDDIDLDKLEVSDGFSDHSEGLYIPEIIGKLYPKLEFYEKHYTLSKNLPGKDHSISVQVDEVPRLKMLLDEKKIFSRYKGRFK